MHRHDNLFGEPRAGKIPLSLLRQAKLEDYDDSEGDRMYRVVLEVAGNSIILGTASSQASRPAAIVQQINQFLANPNQTELSAHVEDREDVGMWIMAGVFFFVGTSFSYSILPPVLTLDLDRSSGTFTICYGKFFRRTRKELCLREISDIAIESYPRSDYDNDPVYYVVVRLFSGETVPLEQSYSSDSSGYDDKKELANLLRQFLYLPPL
ncbi:hypothetical protein D3A95_09130 [Thermosynechococcus sichuanensis E542]|uniref:Uncharacterized protein n=1 Tax=Thermosynechococcus sichuanensis E542 TaxID=2016101 RepID=A0A7D6IMS3_9CYAN|nr:hypothetical protein [Thermosynechococcus vestitus]QLL29329.1 hypothetical protein D3A95_09130 [Thermosynechococcus vestitus E542]